MTQYRYQLERYRGRSTRHVCPQCGRKNVFTRYIDTYNNIYINDSNRLDKYGYHYTPHQYFTDNPWKRDNFPKEDGSLRPCGYHYTPHQYFTDNPWKREKVVALLQDIGKSNKATSNKLPPEPKRRQCFPSIQLHRENGWMEKPTIKKNSGHRNVRYYF